MIPIEIIKYEIIPYLNPFIILDLASSSSFMYDVCKDILTKYCISADISDIDKYIDYCDINNLYYIKKINWNDYILYKPKNYKILKFNCSNSGLYELPKLPMVKKLYCSNNKLKEL